MDEKCITNDWKSTRGIGDTLRRLKIQTNEYMKTLCGHCKEKNEINQSNTPEQREYNVRNEFDIHKGIINKYPKC